MARPFKSGIDYFPLNNKLNDKVILVEAEHGVLGFGIFIKLYQKVYAHNYWINWDKKAGIVFSKSVNVNINEVNAIINSCMEWEIFDKKLFEKAGVLTSIGIQKRFFEIVKRRKRVEITEEYLLVDINKYFTEPEIKTRIFIVNADNNPVNESSSTQRKGKERKVDNKNLPQKSTEGSEEEFYLTKKNRKLQGKRLNSFLMFWSAFNYKKGKAEAADSWLDITELKDSIVDEICKAAKNESENRQDLINNGRTPIFPQGWISGRRWEDDVKAPQKANQGNQPKPRIDNFIK